MKYQDLVEGVGDNYVIYSHVADTGEMLFVSNGFEPMFGLTKEQILGNPWHELIDWEEESVKLAFSVLQALFS